MRTLYLTLKKKWFDMILKGEKKEEYRAIKDYWISRLCVTSPRHFHEFSPDVDFKQFTQVEFKNGYKKNPPTMTVELKGIEIGISKSEWCDEGEKERFVLKLGSVLFYKDCD